MHLQKVLAALSRVVRRSQPGTRTHTRVGADSALTAAVNEWLWPAASPTPRQGRTADGRDWQFLVPLPLPRPEVGDPARAAGPSVTAPCEWSVAPGSPRCRAPIPCTTRSSPPPSMPGCRTATSRKRPRTSTPMGVTVFGGDDRAAVLSAEVDPGAERRGRISRFRRITKIQHFETTPLPRATHV